MCQERCKECSFGQMRQISANKLGVKGWIRNLNNGKVEVLAEGSQDKLNELLKWLRRGPIWANVQAVHHEFSESEKEDYRNFTIHY